MNLFTTPPIPGMEPTPPPEPGPDTRFAHRLHTGDVCAMYGVSPTTLRRWLRTGRFPLPDRLEPRPSWCASELPLLDGGPYPVDTFPRLGDTPRAVAARRQWAARKLAAERQREKEAARRAKIRAKLTGRKRGQGQSTIPGHETPKLLPKKGGKK